jgi:hypothetical protein
MTINSERLARTGVEWIAFTVLVFSALTFLFVFIRNAINREIYWEIVIYSLIYVLIVGVLSITMLKEAILHNDYILIRYVVHSNVIIIPYSKIKMVQYFPSGLGSGPSIVLHYEENSGAHAKTRFGLRRDHEKIISIFRDHGTTVRTSW